MEQNSRALDLESRDPLTVQYVLPENVEAGFRERAETAVPAPSGWGNEATELLKTIHGSTLYGLNHAGSDEDFYTVVPSRYVGRKVRQQSIIGNIDNVVVDFKSFTKMAESGIPQALEAMFSQKTVSKYFEDYRTNYYASSSEVVNRYLRTMKAFILNNRENQTKMRRHSLRLAYNLEELLYTGRFNPTLPPQVAEQVKRFADKPFRDYITELNAFTPIQVEWGGSLARKLKEAS